MKKICIRILLYVLIISGSVACQDQKYDIVRPEDFSFRIIDKIDKYDSQTGIYKREYLSGDTIVKIDLTKEDMDYVYAAFKKNDFLSFPLEFVCSARSSLRLPSYSTTIEVTYKGFNKIVTNTDYCDTKTEQRKSKKFNKFSTEIWTMILQKPQVKNLKQTNIIFR
jgi:hypothetical protein